MTRRYRLTPSRLSRLRLSLGLIGAAAALFFAAGRGGRALARVTRAQYRMGTILEIDVVAPDPTAAEIALAEAFKRVGETEDRLSNWRADSELSRANREASARPFPLTPATFWSLSRALSLARETGGTFDPTIGALTRARGLTGEPPSPLPARSLVGAVGWKRAVLEGAGRALSFGVPGMAIDSGAFGKGEALDRAAVALRRGGVAAARLNFGGQILLFGVENSAGRGFAEVAVAVPDDSGGILCRFNMRDGSVSTSGDAEKPGHLIDPRTGNPAVFPGSVTVIADTGLRADALSTALFVMGPRDGIPFAQRRGIAALFVVRRGKAFSMISSAAFPSLSKSSF